MPPTTSREYIMKGLSLRRAAVPVPLLSQIAFLSHFVETECIIFAVDYTNHHSRRAHAGDKAFIRVDAGGQMCQI